MEHPVTDSSAPLEQLVQAFDWASTDLGPPSGWSTSLRMIVRFVLAGRFPMLLWWGPNYVQVYNDAYVPILGTKHPAQALGRPFRECWHEVFDVLGPLVDVPFHGGPATWMDDIELVVRRHGFAEESHFTIAYSAVPDDEAPNGIGGVLGTVMEITEQVIGERRLTILSELGSRIVEPKHAQDACRQAVELLAGHAKDLPFALLYLLDDDGCTLRLASASGLPAGDGPAAELDLAAPLHPLADRLAQAVASTGTVQVCDGLAALLPAVPPGPGPEAPTQAAFVGLKSGVPGRAAGVLVAGISAYLRPDAQYIRFLELVGGQIATAVANARAYEEERRRAEALAQLDHAKTTFFSNVSHEFRTPLTLMLGPLAEAIGSEGLPARLHTQLDLAQRNAQRLLKLVNSLLDFARLEAGRAEAAFAPVDLAALTRDLASSFRSAMERAGLAYHVEADDLGEPLYIDRAMWEQVVLNLLSNAFKFTFEGEVRVALRREGGQAVLTVADTGVGIPPHELPRLFDRFHRIEGMPARTHEGSGIGLALVQELVQLQGGTVSVDSAPGRGSTFRVALSFGTAHIPPAQIRPAPPVAPAFSSSARAYVDEALRWLPGGDAPAPPDPAAAAPGHDERFRATFGAHILLADDNADMRAYLRGLLEPQYRVQAVSDGQAALESIRRERPDLVMADVMMPRLDGLDLLAQVRADRELREVPVILVSARAGEESRIEGLSAGADDYIVKPFHARELLTRVGSLLELELQRREGEARYRAYVQATHDAVYSMSPDWQEMRQLQGRDFIPDEAGPNLGWLHKYIQPVDQPRVLAAIEQAVATRTPFDLEHRVIRIDGSIGWTHSRAVPLTDRNGHVIEWVGTASDVTHRREAAQALQRSEERYRTLFDSIDEGYCIIRVLFDAQGQGCDYMFLEVNQAFERQTGIRDAVGRTMTSILPAHETEWYRIYGRIAQTGESQRFEFPAEALRKYYDVYAFRIGKPDDHQVAVLFHDISERKRHELALKEADRRKDEFLAMLAHELRNPLAPIRNGLHILRLAEGGANAAAIEQLLPMMQRQVDHMVRLVDDLLEVSRITSGKIELRRSRIDLATVLQSAVETSKPLIEASRHRLAIELPGEPLVVDADPVRLSQVLANLLNNAAKYTEEGGRIRLGAVAEGREAVVTVSDDGLGIPPEMLSRVFDLFTQVDRSHHRAQGGLGIGLTMVRSLVEMHGGHVEAASDGPGRGSVFTLRLPLAAALPPARATAAHRSPQAALAGRRVLVVDDNVDAAESLQQLLELLGLQALAVNDGEAALAALDTFRPDLVLLDIGMPGMDGHTFARHVRERADGQRLQLVAVSGWGREEDQVRSKAAGLDRHLVKPVDLEALERVLAETLGAR